MLACNGIFATPSITHAYALADAKAEGFAVQSTAVCDYYIKYTS